MLCWAGRVVNLKRGKFLSCALPESALGHRCRLLLADRVFGGLLEFFNQARVLSRTWALAGLFDVAWNNKEVTFCGWNEATEYLSNIEESVLELQPGAYSETSVIACVAAVEESFRAKAIELVRGPVVKYPFGLALLEAQRQLAGKWEQRRDLMYANQTRARPTKLAPTQPSKTPEGKSKGSGKNLKGGKLISVKEGGHCSYASVDRTTKKPS